MTAYWLMFFFPIFGVTMPIRLIGKIRPIIWAIAVIVVTVIIGTRYEVGGDWQTLLETNGYLVGKGLDVAVAQESPAYGVINWLSANVGFGIYGVNLVCGALFVVGLAIFCRRQPLPWLAWVVATPYLLIVVGMGYTRQSVALGFLLWGLVYLEDKKMWRYLFLLLIGATFHKTVLLMAPLAILGWRGNFWIRVGLAIALLTAGWILLSEYLFTLWNNYFWKYVDDGFMAAIYQSVGAYYRVWMTAIPAAILLLLWPSWKGKFRNAEIWFWIAIASVGSVFFVGIASTAIDRINLYLAPIQLYFWSRLPVLVPDHLTRTLVITGTIIFYGVALWYWLHFAENSGNWLPYDNIFLS